MNSDHGKMSGKDRVKNHSDHPMCPRCVGSLPRNAKIVDRAEIRGQLMDMQDVRANPKE